MLQAERKFAVSNESRLFDDLARVASGALNAVSGIKTETESVMRQHMEQWLAKMNLVTREEFEVVQAMVAKARDEQEALLERIAALEAQLAAQASLPQNGTSAPRRKTAKEDPQD